MSYQVSRRNFMRGTAGGLALTSFGAPFGAQQAFAADLAREELRTVGLSVTVQERILADFKAKSGVKAVSGKGAIFPDAQTELLSGSTAYDCWETIGERLPAVIATNKIESIPVSALKSWANIRDTFTKPNPKWAKGQQIAGQIWTDDKQTALWMVPTVYNYDSIGYRPDLVSKEEASSRFGFFLEALEYGTPPHGGIALGLDRIVMILAGADSLREVIPFPKTARAVDLMVDAPTPVSEQQLKELGLVVRPPKG